MEELVDTYTPTKSWLSMSEETRRQKIAKFFEKADLPYVFEIVSAPSNGQVVLKTDAIIKASDRGLFLLSLEDKMKIQIDIGITIWLEPVGDKSKLRNLRGVQIKTE